MAATAESVAAGRKLTKDEITEKLELVQASSIEGF